MGTETKDDEGWGESTPGGGIGGGGMYISSTVAECCDSMRELRFARDAGTPDGEAAAGGVGICAISALSMASKSFKETALGSPLVGNASSGISSIAGPAMGAGGGAGGPAGIGGGGDNTVGGTTLR